MHFARRIFCTACSVGAFVTMGLYIIVNVTAVKISRNPLATQ